MLLKCLFFSGPPAKKPLTDFELKKPSTQMKEIYQLVNKVNGSVDLLLRAAQIAATKSGQKNVSNLIGSIRFF